MEELALNEMDNLIEEGRLEELIVTNTFDDVNNTPDDITMHRILCKELNETYEKKNHDYGNSFSETFNKLGIISAITRISDKYNRLVSLCTLPEEERMVKDETISDTLLDMANYCIMTEIELRRSKHNN